MKPIFLFLSILFAVQIGTAQETWNACNSTVTIIPAPSYDSTFVLSAPSRAALAKGMASWTPSTSGGAASYLAYTALLTQSGTDAPVATVLENTLGGTVVWSYVDVGKYAATLSGAFVSAKTLLPNDGLGRNFTKTILMADDFAAINGSISIHRVNDNMIYVYTEVGGSLTNEILNHYPIQIIVYP